MKFLKKYRKYYTHLNKVVKALSMKTLSFLVASSLLVSSSSNVFALEDPSMSQEEIMQISCEVNKILALWPEETRGEIAETIDIINAELDKRLGTKRLAEKICDLAESTVRYLTPIVGSETANDAVMNLGKCFRNVAKNRVLKNYPQDITKLQKIGIDFGKIRGDRCGSSIAANASSSRSASCYVPGVHVKINGFDCLAGFNDFAVPVMQILQEQLSDDLGSLKGAAKKLYYDQLERKAREAIPCGEGFGLDRKELRELVDKPHHEVEFFIPFWQLYVIYDVNEQEKKVNKELSETRKLVEKANMVATTISHLRYYINKFGGDIGPGKPLCLFLMDRKLEGGMHVEEIMPGGPLNRIENTCYEIMCSDAPLDEKVRKLHEGLNICEKALKPYTGDEISKLRFVFVISRVSHYLEQLENYRQGKSLDEILAMRSLRLALNRYAIEYKFMFASQESPILGIRISHCKVIMDNPNCCMIFLERMNAENFQEKVKQSLDNKVRNIIQKYPISLFSEDEIHQIAEKLEPASYQDLIDKLKHQEIELNGNIERKRVAAEEHFFKSSLGKAKLVGNVLKYTADGVDWGIEKAKDFLRIKAAMVTGGLLEPSGIESIVQQIAAGNSSSGSNANPAPQIEANKSGSTSSASSAPQSTDSKQTEVNKSGLASSASSVPQSTDSKQAEVNKSSLASSASSVPQSTDSKQTEVNKSGLASSASSASQSTDSKQTEVNKPSSASQPTVPLKTEVGKHDSSGGFGEVVKGFVRAIFSMGSSADTSPQSTGSTQVEANKPGSDANQSPQLTDSKQTEVNKPGSASSANSSTQSTDLKQTEVGKSSSTIQPKVPQSTAASSAGSNLNNGIAAKPQQNLISQRFPELNLSPEYIEEFSEGCRAMIEMDETRKNLKMVSRQREYWEKVQGYEQDFINLLKLYVQLKKAQLEKVDYDGILIEEKRAVYNNGHTDARIARFNEYIVQKIDQLEEKD